MPRKVRDANLENRTARSRLPVRHKPFFRLIEPGLHLGYRKLASGPGTWLVRRYSGGGRYIVQNLRTADGALVLADDYEDADGERVLTFAQAQRTARGPKRPTGGAYTVADAVSDYLQFLEGDGRSRHSIRDTRARIKAHVLPRLGNLKLTALTADRLRRWRDEIAKTPARLRTRGGEQQKYRQVTGEDATRARRATANRTWTVLRAALSHAFHEGRIDSDIAWRMVKPFRRVDASRVHYLSVAEARRLINACNLDFRPLVHAALQTGCRYGELIRLQVRDFNRDAGTVHVRQSKSGKARHVTLTSEGQAFFSQLTAGRSGDTPMFGKTWGQSHQIRRIREACERAKIEPAIPFHALRHTWASLAVMNGMPLMIVARSLGHRDVRMCERFYSHMSPSYETDAVRRHAPTFGIKPGKITPIR